jgi:hypothetical protein
MAKSQPAIRIRTSKGRKRSGGNLSNEATQTTSNQVAMPVL